MMFARYFIYFVVYSFLGWMYESLFYSIQCKKIVNTGFLRGCFCPIYGLACCANIILLSGVESNLLVFLISMTAISAIEYMVSAVLENVFNKRWWDYSMWPVNLKGRVSLFSSLAFGVMSLLQLRFIHPYIASMIDVVPENVSYIFIAAVSFAIAVDLIFTVRAMDKMDERLWFIDEESARIHRTAEKFVERKKNLSLYCTNVREKIRDRISR